MPWGLYTRWIKFTSPSCRIKWSARTSRHDERPPPGRHQECRARRRFGRDTAARRWWLDKFYAPVTTATRPRVTQNVRARRRHKVHGGRAVVDTHATKEQLRRTAAVTVKRDFSVYRRTVVCSVRLWNYTLPTTTTTTGRRKSSSIFACTHAFTAAAAAYIDLRPVAVQWKTRFFFARVHGVIISYLSPQFYHSISRCTPAAIRLCVVARIRHYYLGGGG